MESITDNRGLCKCGCGHATAIARKTHKHWGYIKGQPRDYVKGHHKYPDPTAHFWGRVDKNGPIPKHRPDLGPCWLWTGPRNSTGYGQGHHSAVKSQRTHRIAYEITYGPIPEGQLACHHCDNPPCCNPAHLFLGTHLDNHRDRGAKGRTASGDRSGTRLHPETRARGERSGSKTHPESILRGEAHSRAKLNWEKVRAIRASYAQGHTGPSLAKQFNVGKSTIYHILYGESWKEAA